MPVIPPRSESLNLHPDVHHWHARQSYSSLSASSSSTSNSIIIPIAVVSVVVMLILGLGIARCLMKAQGSAYVAPRPVVQAPSGSRLGPVTAEILSGAHSRTGAQDSTYVSPRSVVWAPPGSRLGPVTSEILAGMGSQGGTVARGSASNSATAGDVRGSLTLPSANDNDRRSRTSLVAGIIQADVDDPPRTVIIHRDAGSAPREVEAAPIELPPPYSSISLA